MTDFRERFDNLVADALGLVIGLRKSGHRIEVIGQPEWTARLQAEFDRVADKLDELHAETETVMALDRMRRC